MELKEIILGFKDCDAAVINAKTIKGISLDDIKESIVGFSCDVETRKQAKHFALQLNAAANKSFNDDPPYGARDTFERIAIRQDIVDVTLVYEKSESNVRSTVRECYSLYWTDSNEQENPAQKAYITAEGELCLVVSKKKKLEDFFSFYKTEEREDADFYLSW